MNDRFQQLCTLEALEQQFYAEEDALSEAILNYSESQEFK